MVRAKPLQEFQQEKVAENVNKPPIYAVEVCRALTLNPKEVTGLFQGVAKWLCGEKEKKRNHTNKTT